MKASEIIAIVEKIAAPGLAAPWDASGVQVAGLEPEVSRVAVMLDPVRDNMRKAVEDGADFILCHHPLSMKPRFPNRADAYLAILSLLLSRGVWLYSAHTPLDANPCGPVRWLAGELRLEDVKTLEATAPAEGPAFAPGFGFIGRLPQALPYADFCRRLSSALGRREWQVCGPKPDMVAAVACCPGSGGALAEEALAAGADLFITGDVKYHAALDARTLGLRILDVGHFVLEEEMMRRFAAVLAKELPVPVRFYPSLDPLAPERVEPQTEAPEEENR